MASNQKKILLLELEDYSWLGDMYTGFLNNLHSKSNVVKCTTPATTLATLGSGDVSAILVFEPLICQTKHKKLAEAVAKYTREGGTTIFACACSNFVTPPNLDRFFEQSFNQPWKFGDYLRTTYAFNTATRLKLADSVSSSYSMKAVSLTNVATEDLLYITTENSVRESLVFGPSRVNMNGEGPVVFAQYQRGKLGWVGDVNNEEETGPLVIAMLGI